MGGRHLVKIAQISDGLERAAKAGSVCREMGENSGAEPIEYRTPPLESVEINMLLACSKTVGVRLINKKTSWLLFQIHPF